MSTDPEIKNVSKSDLVKRAREEFIDRWEVTVAESHGEILGFLALAPSEKRLDQIFIKPGSQGCGIGERLMEISKQRFPEGFWLMVSADNSRARVFYEREGLTRNYEGDETASRISYIYSP